MTTFIRLHTDIDKLVFINPAHIVKIEEQGYPPRTLISTVDDSMTAVTEYPYQVLDRIWREEKDA